MNQCPECEKPKYVKCCHNCKKDAGKCEVYHACGDDCPEWEEMTKTNADRIRAMSDEELANMLTDFSNNGGWVTETGREICYERHIEWLKQPAEEGDGNG